MYSNKKTGKTGEHLAEIFLTNKNYEILEKNWRHSHLEADIIARKNNFIVFVEVKTRKNKYLNFDEIITPKKQKNLINLAEKYLEIKNIDAEIRFDVIIIHKNNNQYSIEHIENAFYPTIE